MIDPLPFLEDFLLAQKCLEDDPLSISRLQEICETQVMDYLVHTGATAEQAWELANELKADCLAERGKTGRVWPPTAETLPCGPG
ncbi:MAG: hypothetical protein WDN28_29355 [Chthoniobacter sp.]